MNEGIAHFTKGKKKCQDFQREMRAAYRLIADGDTAEISSRP
jgi:hypothetical protein